MIQFIALFIHYLATALQIALVCRVLISWFNIGPSNSFYPIISIINQITEPVLAPIRKLLPNFGMLDLSPMAAILLMMFLERFITRLIMSS